MAFVLWVSQSYQSLWKKDKENEKEKMKMLGWVSPVAVGFQRTKERKRKQEKRFSALSIA